MEEGVISPGMQRTQLQKIEKASRRPPKGACPAHTLSPSRGFCYVRSGRSSPGSRVTVALAKDRHSRSTQQHGSPRGLGCMVRWFSKLC